MLTGQVALGLVLAVQSALGEAQTPSAAQAFGKALYHHGVAGPDHALHGTVAGVALPPSALACANCHGADGAGGREARITAPPLRRDRLLTSSISTHALRHALTSPSPVSGMAHYEIDDTTLAALEAYLQVLGTESDVDPGISDTRIVLGALLPMTGSLSSVGADAATELRRAFDQVNAQGGVYGRHLELEVQDTQATLAGNARGLDALVEGWNVFALIGSIIPDSDPLVDALARAHLPVIGAITASGGAGARASSIHFLLPSLSDQARALIDHIASGPDDHASVAVLSLGGQAYDDGIEGALQQAAKYPGLRVKKVQVANGLNDASQLRRALDPLHFDYLLYFCAPAHSHMVMQALADRRSPTTALTSIMTAGGVGALSRAAAPHPLLLAYPAVLRRSQRDVGTGERNEAVRALAEVSAQITIDVLKDIGRILTRTALSSRLVDIRKGGKRDLPTSPRDSVSRPELTGIYVLSYDAATRSLTPVSDPIMPRD